MRRLWRGAWLVLALLVFPHRAAALPVESVQRYAAGVGRELTFTLPHPSALQGWSVVECDTAHLELRALTEGEGDVTLKLAGIAPGTGVLILKLAYLGPPGNIVETRRYELTVTGPAPRSTVGRPPAPTARPVGTAAADTRPRVSHIPPLPAAPAVSVPAAAPTAPPTPRAIPRPVLVTAPGELVDGKPRREKLETVQAWIAVGDQLAADEFYDRALEEYDRARAFELPAELAARLLTAAADCQERLDRVPEAIELYSTIVTRYPATSSYAGARLALGRIYRRQARYADALTEILYLKREKGNTAAGLEAGYQAAQLYEELRRFDEALAEYQRLLVHEGRPEWRARLWFALGSIYDREPSLRDYFRAVDYYGNVTVGELAPAARERIAYIRREFL